MNKYQDYWIKRNEQLFLEGENDILKYTDSLKSQYNKAIKTIEEKINAFYGKYQTATGMDMATIKKTLSKEELKSFKYYLNELVEYAKDHKFDKTYRNDIKLLKLKTNISRLQELETQIRFEIEKLNNNIDTSISDELGKVYEDGYYKTIFNNDKSLGMAISFNQLNTKAIQKAISTTYMTENYSQVLWRNKNSLLNILNQQIPQGIILGYNPKKVASIASKKLDTNYKSTVRLVRTEYNLILNDAVGQGLHECGIDRYEIVATLDNRTSEICQEMDGKVFETSKKEIGVNYPPFHPNCRTTVTAYFEYDDIDEMFESQNYRLAKDKDGNYYNVPDYINYKQWKAGLKDVGDGLMRYESTTKMTSEEIKVKRELDTYQQIINKYVNKDSKWNGMVHLTDEGISGVLPNGNINILNDSSKIEKMHELLHTYSYSYDIKNYKKNKTLEEGSVELLNKNIAIKESIQYEGSGYDSIVKILSDINKKCELYEDELDFAIELFNKPITDRYDFLYNKIINSENSSLEILDKLSKLEGNELYNKLYKNYNI